MNSPNTWRSEYLRAESWNLGRQPQLPLLSAVHVYYPCVSFPLGPRYPRMTESGLQEKDKETNDKKCMTCCYFHGEYGKWGLEDESLILIREH